MYYRRKILLALLEAFENRLEKISLQKLLMLVSNQQEKPNFHFVPYKLGCYSFQANADLYAMTKNNQVKEEGSHWIKTDAEKQLPNLKVKDHQAIIYIKMMYGKKNVDELIKFTYFKFPYLAINSIIAKQMLSTVEYQRVIDAKPVSDKVMLFTIGFDGISLEEYLNKLILNNVRVLCDVRKDTQSMKFGFSKPELMNACDGVGIGYVHIPELGIEHENKQGLNSLTDFDKQFSFYLTDILPRTIPYQEGILANLKEKGSVALTCFETNSCHCHRKYLAEAIVALPNFDYQLKHI